VLWCVSGRAPVSYKQRRDLLGCLLLWGSTRVATAIRTAGSDDEDSDHKGRHYGGHRAQPPSKLYELSGHAMLSIGAALAERWRPDDKQ